MADEQVLPSNFIEKLRYPTFEGNRDLIRFVGSVMKIPTSLTDTISNQEKCASAMSGVIMYRQLNRVEKMQVMELIYSLPNKNLMKKLVEKVTDVTVQPQWGLWSLSNDELQEIIDFHSKVSDESNFWGINPGALGVAGSAWGIIQKVRSGVRGPAMGKNIVGLVLSITLMGVSLISADQLKLSSEERERRRVFAK